MADDAVRYVLHGVAELEADLLKVIVGVVVAAQHGFVPEHRYHGEGGVPFTGDTIDLVATQSGFMVTDRG